MVTEQEIKKLAKLARLNPAEEELKALTEEMSDIIAFADTINQTVGDIDMRSTHARVTEWENLREDVPAPSLPNEEILQNVNGGTDGYYTVQRSKAK